GLRADTTDDTVADTLSGGAEDDTYLVAAGGGDQVIEAAGEGIDTVLLIQGSTTAYTLAANVENLALLDPASTTGFTLIGNDLDNVITGGNGNDSLDGGQGDNWLIGGTNNDTLSGGSGKDTIIAGTGNDIVFEGGGSNSLDGGADTDRLTFTTSGFYDIQRAGAGGPLTIRFLGADSASAGTSTSTAANFEEFSYNRGIFDLTAPGWDGTDILYVCFAAGTRILTAMGEVAVEQLRPGDRVVTLGGRGLPVKPVLWVGRRHVVLAGRADAADMAPIRVKAGALGPNTPKRDLVVSPDHCLYLDGALVPARLLVNGRSVVAEIGMAEVTWYHVEL
ncbi:MAG: Hint domain-containing protein, partial [Roseomonas sp.]|nr:Hint domain-containing protein [Roseomonas sp.]